MSDTPKCWVPLEDATKEELIAALRSTKFHWEEYKACLERNIWSMRCDSISDEIRVLLDEAQSYHQTPGQPVDYEKRRNWEACHKKIDRLQKQWNKLLNIPNP